MKKRIATILVALLVLFPKTSWADLDVLSIVQDNLKVFQEKANTIIQGYIGIQVNLQEIAMNRDILGSLRDTVKEQLQDKWNGLKADIQDAAIDSAKEFVNSQLSSVVLPGLNTSISFGPYTSPVLKQKVAKSYVKRTNQKSDVVVTAKQDDRNNREMVENLATIYSNALVRRKQLIDRKPIGCDNTVEENEEDATSSDVNTLQYTYGLTSRRANCRWLEIMRYETAYRKMLSEIALTQGRIEDISEIVGKEEQEIDTDGLQDIEAEVIGSRDSVDVLALREQWNRGLDAAKNGDYAGALNAAASAYGTGAVAGNQNIVDIVEKGASGAGKAYNSAVDGDWGGMVDAAGGAVGGSLGGEAGRIVNTATSGGGNVINDVVSGDWNSVVVDAGGAVGGSLGGNTGDEINATGNIIGGGMDIISAGGDANEVFDNIMTNNNIQNGLDDLGGLDTSREDAAAEAAEQLRQDEEEKLRQQMQENVEKARQEIRQKQCQSCREAAIKANKDPGTSCLGSCS